MHDGRSRGGRERYIVCKICSERDDRCLFRNRFSHITATSTDILSLRESWILLFRVRVRYVLWLKLIAGRQTNKNKNIATTISSSYRSDWQHLCLKYLYGMNRLYFICGWCDRDKCHTSDDKFNINNTTVIISSIPRRSKAVEDSEL